LKLSICMVQFVLLLNEIHYKKRGLVPRSFLKSGLSSSLCSTSAVRRSGTSVSDMQRLQLEAPKWGNNSYKRAKIISEKLVPEGFGGTEVPLEKMINTWKTLEGRKDLTDDQKRAIAARIWMESCWKLKHPNPESVEVSSCKVDHDYMSAVFTLNKALMDCCWVQANTTEEFLEKSAEELKKVISEKLYERNVLGSVVEFTQSDITNKSIRFITAVDRHESRNPKGTSYTRIPSNSQGNHILKVAVQIWTDDDSDLASDRNTVYEMVDTVVTYLKTKDKDVSLSTQTRYPLYC
jgi:hypothetical protein